MIGVFLLCVAFAFGMPWWRVLVLAAVLVAPLVVAVVIAVVTWRSRGSDDNRSALFCEGVASELRAGASLRQALSAAALSVGCAPPMVDSPLSAVAGALSGQFADIADELELTIVAAARSGSAAAAIFDELGSLALAQSEIRREVRIATAPARATALVFMGVPAIFVVTRLSSGQTRALLESTQQRMVTLLGLGLFLLGLTVSCLVAWRA